MTIPRSQLTAKVRQYATLNKVDFDEAWPQCAALYPDLFKKTPAATLGNCHFNGMHKAAHAFLEHQAKAVREYSAKLIEVQKHPFHIRSENARGYVRENFSTLANAASNPLPNIFQSAKAREALKLGIEGDNSSVTPEEFGVAAAAAAPSMTGLDGDPDHEQIFRALTDHHMKAGGLDRAAAQDKVRSRHPALAAAAAAHTIETDPNSPVVANSRPALANEAPSACLPRSFSSDDARALGLSNASDQVLCYAAFIGNGGSVDPAQARLNKSAILGAVIGFFVGRFGVSPDAARTMAIAANPALA